ncbi:uncharacterized protein MELLADRAFT_89341 [Melampsora larici-populina 98AG31]|uniref:Uncharacterized protein n=1 Tax=Melampsora larici-populina (strain 98AG31 / pathotype 3-4-7) TaxID=747676 RepID=F4R5T2_MELLP|nr:uncharacterized protein MELLADRAFT_89341 [Melampsora larici-populina 98AG31]EGG12095.1 hypothetical protein MELLADRAFT_89341 [Melampsora larici-populina 98AG31]
MATLDFHALKADLANLFSEEDCAKGAVEDVGIVGPKTSRPRLLELLEKRILKRGRRLTSKAPQKTPDPNSPKAHVEGKSLISSQDPPNPDAPIPVSVEGKSLDCSPSEEADTSDPQEIDYQIYSNKVLEKMLQEVGLDTFGMDKSKLVENFSHCSTFEEADTSDPQEIDYQIYSNKVLEKMLQEVGLNTFGMDKSNLVENCKIYHELIIPPVTCEPEHRVASTSTAQKQSDDMQRSFTFSTTSKEVLEWGSRYGRNDITEPLQKSLPSVEHGTLLYPRPRPTDLSKSHSMHSKSIKGKEKECRESDSDFIPEDEDLFNDQDLEFEQTENHRSKGKQSGMVSDDEALPKDFEFERTENHRSEGMQSGMALENEVLPEESVMSNKELTKLWKETKLLLIKANKRIERLESELKSMSEAVRSSVGNRNSGNINGHARGGRTADHGPGVDPCFPYPNGPGHREASPQQLSVTWELMKAAGVESFRPDLGDSPVGSVHWDFSGQGQHSVHKKVFLVPHTDPDEKQTWDKEQKLCVARNVRRATRLCRLRAMRSKIALEEKTLWPLLSVIKVTCSDDETDTEEAQNLTPGKGLICACKLSWRSKALESLLVRLEARKGTLDQSVPKNSNSPQRGRPSRPRIRRNDASESLIEAPEGLPRDCYSQEFLEQLGSKGQAMLGIQPEIGLTEIMIALDSI